MPPTDTLELAFTTAWPDASELTMTVHCPSASVSPLEQVPPVIDARDVLLDPERVLGLLCEALDVPFTSDMLSWPSGPRETDGIWAKHWYEAVEASTGFGPYCPKVSPISEPMTALHESCLECYAVLSPHRLGGT